MAWALALYCRKELIWNKLGGSGGRRQVRPSSREGAPCRSRMGFPANVLSFLWNQMEGWVGDLRREVTGNGSKVLG